MKLHTDHLAYLIHLESGIKTEFFSALSATKKKIVLDLAEAKLVLVSEANQILVRGHVNDIFKSLTEHFNKVATELAHEVGEETTEETEHGETK